MHTVGRVVRACSAGKGRSMPDCCWAADGTKGHRPAGRPGVRAGARAYVVWPVDRRRRRRSVRNGPLAARKLHSAGCIVGTDAVERSAIPMGNSPSDGIKGGQAGSAGSSDEECCNQRKKKAALQLQRRSQGNGPGMIVCGAWGALAQNTKSMIMMRMSDKKR
eukprot:GGOE01032763.1.p1 GENE.GGOE01032763.1~~GGOE01032763.1.p1  ORF type:complete len:163 (-),score=4.04 GGOE01032763.1:699-1187(-)